MNAFKKIWYLLTPRQRRTAVVLLGLMLIGMMLEALSITLVIPALALMTQSDWFVRYPALEPYLSTLSGWTQEQLVIAGVLILVGIYAVKALFLAFLVWTQMRFVFDVQAGLSQRLYVGYLRQPYTFHLLRNSANLIRNVVTETGMFGNYGLVSGLTLLTEILVVLGISVLLLIVEPIGALLVTSTLGLASLGFHRLTRSHILRWGEARQLHEGLRLQHLQQGFGGAKDLKLLGREREFLGQYWLHNVGSARVGQRQYTFQQLPRLWLEFLAVTGLALLIVVLVGQGTPLAALVPSIGLFAAAAFRLLPSINRIIGAVQNVRYALPVINTLYSEVRLVDGARAPERGKSLPFHDALILDNVAFRYESAEMPVLRGVTLSITHGTSVGFIGGSGAGKSTLVDIILGLLAPSSGVVLVDGVDIQKNLRGWQDQIGYVQQSIFLTDDTLRRNIAFGLPNDQIDEAAVWRAIRAAQLEEFVNELPLGLDTLVGERGVRLSGGQRQRIGIARALYHEPSVLVLDEATSSLDLATEQGVMESVKALRGNKTILIVAHRLSTVAHCDRLYRLEQGRVVAMESETAVR